MATAITVLVGTTGTGSLDHFLSATKGTLEPTDGGNLPGTLSTGALAGVGSGVTIDIQAQTSISFKDLGTLSLQTGLGVNASFSAGTGAIAFANTGNTVSTAGGALTFDAGTDLTVSNLNTNGGDVSLTAGTAAAGDLNARAIITAGSGNITFEATNAAGGSITQSGTASGLAISATATDGVTVDALQGSTVSLTSNTASVLSATAFKTVQASAQLSVAAATGIGLNTLAASLQASNSTSGDIFINQFVSPAQTLTLAGTGVVNSAAGGEISLVNKGSSLTLPNGSTVQSNNGAITLAGTDLQINGTVNAGSGRATLTTSQSGEAIDLGSNTAGTVGLTQTELNNVTAGVLQIGHVLLIGGLPGAGTINVSAAITAPAGWSTLTLINTSTITEAAAGSLTVPNLNVGSTGPVTLTSVNHIANLAGGPTNAFAINNGTNTLTIPNAGVDGVLGITTTNANITLQADNIVIKQVVTPGTGSVILEPFTTTLNITLGTASVPGTTFGLTNGNLGWITSGVTQVGVAADTGTIAITSAINRTPTSTAPSRSQTLSLVTGNTGSSAITQTAPLSVASLAAQAVGPILLTNAGNDVDHLAGAVSGSGNDFDYTDTNGFALSTVVGVAGITTTGHAGDTPTLTAGGPVTQDAGASINSDRLQLLGAGPYTLNDPGNNVSQLVANVTHDVSYTNAVFLTLNAFLGTNGVTSTSGAVTIHTLAGSLQVLNNVSAATEVDLTLGSMVANPDSTLTNNATIRGASGVHLTADRMALQGGTISTSTGGSNIVSLSGFSAGRPIDLGGMSDPTGTLTISQAELNTITTDVLRVGDLQHAGDITITAALTDTTTGFSSLSLLSGEGGISQNSGATLTVANLQAAGNAGVALNENNSVLQLAGAAESGAFRFTDNTNLTVASVDAGLGNGFGVGIITHGQAIGLTVDVVNDLLTVDQPLDTTHDFSAGGAPAGADVTLTADHMFLGNAGTSRIDAGTSGIVSLTPFTASKTISLGARYADQVTLTTPNAGANSFSLALFTGTALVTIPETGSEPDNVSALRLQTDFNQALTDAGVSGSVSVSAPSANVYNITYQGPLAINPALTLLAYGTALPVVQTLGGPAGTLGLRDVDLAIITAQAIRIGSAAQTGTIRVDGAITTHPGYNTLDLIATGSGGAIIENGGSIAVANLALQADAGIGSAVALDVVGPINVAFQNATSGNVAISSTGPLTIAAVDGVSTSANNAPGGTVTLTAASPITFAVDTTSSGTISATTTETADESGMPPPPEDDLTVNRNVTVESTGSDVDFTAGDSIILQLGSVVKSDTGTVSLSAGVGDDDDDAQLILDGTIGTATGFDLTFSGDICLGTIDAPGQTVTITSTDGAILDCNDPPTGTLNITAGTLTLSAATGIGVTSTNPPIDATNAALETQVSTLTVVNRTSGDINVVNLSGDVAVSGSNSASGGGLSLTGLDGNQMTVTTGGLSTTDGPITLSADDMTINAPIDAGSGDVTLQQGGTTTRAIDLGSTTVGSLGLTAAEINRVTAGILFIGRADNAGSITFSAPITPAGTTQIELFTGGAIVNTLATGADITVTRLALSAQTGIGVAKAITTQVSNLEAETVSGGLFITNGVSGAITLNIGGVDENLAGVRVTGPNGDLALTNTGTINVVTDGDTVRGMSDVTVMALGAMSDIVTGGQTASGLAAIRITPGGTGDLLVHADRDILVGGVMGTNGSIGSEAGDVVVTAGRDLKVNNNAVGTLSSTAVTSGDVTIVAGRDLVLSNDAFIGNESASTTAGTLTFMAGRDLLADFSAIGDNGNNSTSDGGVAVTAGRNIALTNGTVVGAFFNQAAQTDGVTVSAGGDVFLDDSFVGTFSKSSLTVTAGTAGLGSITAQDISEFNTAGGAINLTTSVGGTFTLTSSGSQIDSTTNGPHSTGGPITISADVMSIWEPISASLAGIVTLQQAGTTALPIDLGGAGSGTRLALTDAELDEITAGILRIGRTDNAGSITVTDPIDAGTNYTTLSLRTGGGETQNSGATLTVTNLAIDAVNAVTLDQANNVSGALAAVVTGSGSGFTFSQGAATRLTIGTADGIDGITANDGAITVSTTSSNLEVEQNVSAGDAEIQATAGGSDSTLTNSAAISNDGGQIIVLIADRMALTGSGSSAITADDNGDVILKPFTSGRLINLGSMTDVAANTLELSGAELATITCSILEVGIAAAGDVTVSAAITITDADTLDLRSGGGVTNNSSMDALTVSNLAIEVGNAVSLTGPNGVSGNLAATVVHAGQGFTFTNADSLEIGSAFGVNGILTNGGAVTVKTTAGDLSIRQAIYAASASMDLTAGGLDSKLFNTATITNDGVDPITLTADRMDLEAVITNTSTGRVTLQAQTASRPIDLGSMLDPTGSLNLSNNELNLIQTGGVLQVGNSSAGDISQTDDVIFPVSAAIFSLVTGGGVTQNSGTHLSAPELAIQAGKAVSLTAGNNVFTALAANVTGTGQGFSFTQDFDQPLTIGTVDNVAGITTKGGAIAVSTVDGDLAVDGPVLAGAAAISFTAGGSDSKLSNSRTITNGGVDPITLAADRMDLGAVITNTSTGRVTLHAVSVGRLIDLGSTTDVAPNTLEVSNNELNEIQTSGVLQVGDATAGDIHQTDDVIFPASAAVLSLITAGGVSQSAGKHIIAPDLAIRAVNAVSLDGNNKIFTTLAGLVTGAGQAFHFTQGFATSLTIGTVDGLNGINSQGDIQVVVNASLTLPGGLMIQSTAGTVSLTAGNNGNGAAINLFGTIFGTAVNVSGGTGSDTFNINPTSASASMTIDGLAGSDTFNIAPKAATAFMVHGGLPTPPALPGDSLFLVLAGTTNPTLSDSFDPASGFSGTWTFGNRQSVHFDTIETLTQTPDLVVTMSAAPTGTVATNLTYFITVTNVGPTLATGLTLSDTLPATVTFVSGTSSQGSVTATNHLLSGDLGNLAPGASISISLVVTPTRTGTITNTVNVFPSQAAVDPDHNTATVTTAVDSFPSSIITGIGAGSSEVKVFDAATGTVRFDFFAFSTGTQVRVALGDITGDGVPDLLVGTGPGSLAEIKVFDGLSGVQVRDFFVNFAFNAVFTGGVNVAAGDVNADGFADMVVGADAGGAPEVKVFSGKNYGLPGNNTLLDFLAAGVTVSGGVRVAAADLNGDGHADIVAGAGAGGPPIVKVYSGADSSLLFDFAAFSAAFTGGIYVAGGDVNGDGHADIIVGAGRNPQVQVFNGTNNVMLASFFAYESSFTGGVRVGAADVNGDGRDDLLTGPGPGRAPQVLAYDELTLAVVDNLFAYNTNFQGGIYVGGQ